MAQNLPANRIFSHILLINTDSLSMWVNLNDTWREAILELRGKLWRDGFLRVENDEGEDAVRCGSYPDIVRTVRTMKVAMKTSIRTNRTEFRMILSNSFHCMQLHLYSLSWSQLDQYDVGICRCWRIVGKNSFLFPLRDPF